MSAIFTADLHLKLTGGKKKNREFRKFIDYITADKDIDKLYLLGDLFIYWYEHPKIDLYSNHPAFKALRSYSKSGGSVYFLKGNRDFMAGKYFRQYSNVDFIGDNYVINTPDKNIFLTHGDMLAKKDIRYRIWSFFVRFPLASYIFKRLPVQTAISVVDRFKKVGKKDPTPEQAIASMITEEAVKHFKNDCDVIITGHAHYKVSKEYTVEEEKKKLYILPEFSFPGQFLMLKEDGRLEYNYLG